MRLQARIVLANMIGFLGSIVGLVQTAQGQSLGGTQPAKEGIFSLVEFNPADLMWGRYRVVHENLLFEGFSVAWLGEWQDTRRKSVFDERSFSTGLSLQYYPQSVTLQGPFLRGETAVALSGVREDAQAKKPELSTNQMLLRVAGDLGWRVRLSDRLTGSAAYGLRTTLPQVLWSQNEELSQRWLDKGESLDVRVQINLGVLL